MAKYVSIDSTFFHNLPFENAILKLMDGNESQLTAAKRIAGKSICIGPDGVDDEDNFPPSSYVQRIETK